MSGVRWAGLYDTRTLSFAALSCRMHAAREVDAPIRSKKWNACALFLTFVCTLFNLIALVSMSVSRLFPLRESVPQCVAHVPGKL
jgi:hypothetical protein